MSTEMLKGMVTEQELLKLMNLKPSELTSLSLKKGLPFVKLSWRTRAYLEDDLMEWFKKHRVILDRDLNRDVNPNSNRLDTPDIRFNIANNR